MMHPISGTLKPDTSSVVVFIDGACRGNGTASARASWGVYFGPQSPYNAKGLLDPCLHQTSTRAEIEALLQAMLIIKLFVLNNLSLREVYIISDSAYLVMTMSVWLGGWIRDHGRNAAGKRVAHFDILTDILEWMGDIMNSSDGEINIEFLHVSREMNREADALANQAFDALR